MAAASSSSSSRSPPNKRTDKFRPQYPINPFGPSTSTRTTSPSSTSSGFSEPWLLKSDQISFSAAHRRDVVLCLGTPSGRSVAALLASQSLVHSLVIFASHHPPTLPSSPVPTIRVLRLASPLAVEDTGAARLVSTLEWAERVARVWRASGSDGTNIVRYDYEATKDVPSHTTSSRSRDAVNMPSASVESFGKSPFRSMRGLSVLLKRRSSLSSAKSLPPVDLSQRPFDAILNYIPRDVAEKQILKQTILVTSITRPFLAPTLSPYHKLSGAKRNGRRNSGRRPSVDSLPPTPPYQSGDFPTPASSSMTAISVLSTTTPPPPSHMIHIVPATMPIGLARGLDSFLSSFSQQPVNAEEVDHAKQYILSTSTSREFVSHDQDEFTILDLILLGGLDSVSGKSWVGSGRDLRFLPTSGRPSPSSTPPVPPPKPVRPPSRTSRDSTRPADPVSSRRTPTHPSPQTLPPSSSSSSRKPRGSDDKKPERSQTLSERHRPTLPNPPLRSVSVRRPRPQGYYQPSSHNTSYGRAAQSSKPSMITEPDHSLSNPLGLHTPPDSDEGVRRISPRPPTPASEVLTPQKRKIRWQFWRP